MHRYAVNNWLLGDMPLDCTRTWAWLNQFAGHDADLVRLFGNSLADVRAEFSQNGIGGIERLLADFLCPPGKLMFINRTSGEIDYL